MGDQDASAQAHKLLGHNTEVPIKPDNAIIRTLRSCCVIPQRYILGVVCMIGACNAYTMRVSLNIAITQMLRVNETLENKFDPDACPSDDIINNITSVVINKPYAIFDWDQSTQGLILSGFYYGYAVTQFPGGYLAEKFGGKWTLGIGLLSTAILTFLTPVVIRAGGATWLFILRVLQGMGEGPIVPVLMNIMARWVPPDERSFQSALIFGGAQVGNIFGFFMSGILLADGRDWAYVFYFFGGFGIFWFILWSLLCYSTPNTHPYISKEELAYLNKNVPGVQAVSDPIPWKAIVRSAPVWALVCGAVSHDYGYYVMVSDLPKYSNDVLKFNIATTGTLTALPYIAKWISSFLFGIVCDYSIKKRWHSIKTGRMIYTTISATGPAICIVLASYAGCNRTLAMVYFILSMTLMGGFYSGMKVNTLDISPNYAGSITSLINTISTFGGIVAPYLVGIMTPNSSLAEWRGVFWVCFAVLVGTNVAYCIWMDGEQQWWDDIRQYGYPANWKHGPLINRQDINIKKTNPKDIEKKKNKSNFD